MGQQRYEPIYDEDLTDEHIAPSITKMSNYIFQLVLVFFLLVFVGITAYLIFIAVQESGIRYSPLHPNFTSNKKNCDLKDKLIILHNYLRAMHGAPPFSSAAVINEENQIIYSLRLLSAMSAISTNVYMVPKVGADLDVVAIVLSWWWPQCDCAYNFGTGAWRENCSIISFKNLVWNDRRDNITIVPPSKAKPYLEVYYPYYAEEFGKQSTKKILYGTWKEYLTCSSVEASLRVLRKYLEEFCY